MSNIIRAAATALTLLGMASTAQAATVELDERMSSVDAAQTVGNCTTAECNVEIQLADAFPDPESFDLVRGETTTFDLVDITVTNTVDDVYTDYELSASLALTIFEGIESIEVQHDFTGTLYWRDDLVFVVWNDDTAVYEAFGFKYTVDLSDEFAFSFSGFRSNETLTSSASISVLTVPLPASGATLLAGIGLLAMVTRRRRS